MGRDELEPLLEERARVGKRSEEVICGEHAQRVLGRRLEPLDRDLVHAYPVRRSTAASKDDGSVAHRLDLELPKGVEPALERGFVLVR